MKLAQRIVLEYYRKKFRALAIVSPQAAANAAFNLFCTPYSPKGKDIPTAIFHRATALQLQIGNERVNGFKWQPSADDNGNTILICHGFDSCSYRFASYVEDFLQQGFSVLAFDAPGHGTSDGKTITVLKYIDMLEAIYKTYGPVYGMMAHSFGGLAATLYLEKNPDSPCKKLVLVAPSTETEFAMEKFSEYLALPAPVKKAFFGIVENMSGKPASWFSVARAIKNVSIPTLWIHDKKDAITPYMHMHHLINDGPPNVQFHITEGLGHSPYRDENIRTMIVSFFAQQATIKNI